MKKTQIETIRDFMCNNGYFTLAYLSERLGFGAASISAQLRNLRKRGFILTKDWDAGRNAYVYELLPPQSGPSETL